MDDLLDDISDAAFDIDRLVAMYDKQINNGRLKSVWRDADVTELTLAIYEKVYTVRLGVRSFDELEPIFEQMQLATRIAHDLNHVQTCRANTCNTYNNKLCKYIARDIRKILNDIEQFIRRDLDEGGKPYGSANPALQEYAGRSEKQN